MISNNKSLWKTMVDLNLIRQSIWTSSWTRTEWKQKTTGKSYSKWKVTWKPCKIPMPNIKIQRTMESKWEVWSICFQPVSKYWIMRLKLWLRAKTRSQSIRQSTSMVSNLSSLIQNSSVRVNLEYLRTILMLQRVFLASLEWQLSNKLL